MRRIGYMRTVIIRRPGDFSPLFPCCLCRGCLRVALPFVLALSADEMAAPVEGIMQLTSDL